MEISLADLADVNRLHAEKELSATDIELKLMVAKKKQGGNTMSREETEQVVPKHLGEREQREHAGKWLQMVGENAEAGKSPKRRTEQAPHLDKFCARF